MVVAVKIWRLILEGGLFGNLVSAFKGTVAGVGWLSEQHGASLLGDCCPGPTMGSGVPTPKGA